MCIGTKVGKLLLISCVVEACVLGVYCVWSCVKCE